MNVGNGHHALRHAVLCVGAAQHEHGQMRAPVVLDALAPRRVHLHDELRSEIAVFVLFALVQTLDNLVVRVPHDPDHNTQGGIHETTGRDL